MIASAVLGAGIHSLTIRQIDLAGNVSSASAALALTIDATAAAPSAPSLVAESRIGPSGANNLTSVTAPMITGSDAEPGAVVTLHDTYGAAILGTVTADGSGNWSFTCPVLGDGVHALTAVQTDLAGNVSDSSGELTVTIVAPKSGVYVLQGIDPIAVATAPFDVKVIGPSDDMGRIFAPAQVSQMGGGPGGGLLLGYVSLGEAETYRDYFANIPPAAIGPEDSRFPGSYQVAYWTDEWRSVVTGSIDRLIAAGFDGAVFDVVDEYLQPWAQITVPGGDSAAAMIGLVKYLAECPRAKDPAFQIWVNGGELLVSNDGYLQAIDGLFKESLFYDGTGNLQPASGTSYRLGFLQKAAGAGKSIINIEYVSGTAQIADVHAKAAAAGIGSYIAQRNLKGIDMEGVLPSQTLAMVTAVSFSADSGTSATDLITNVAAQTVAGTLSHPLGAGDRVKLSLDYDRYRSCRQCRRGVSARNGRNWLSERGYVTYRPRYLFPAWRR